MCRPNLGCSGRPHYNTTLTAYYPDFTSDDESDYLDCQGNKLRSLQVNAFSNEYVIRK